MNPIVTISFLENGAVDTISKIMKYSRGSEKGEVYSEQFELYMEICVQWIELSVQHHAPVFNNLNIVLIEIVCIIARSYKLLVRFFRKNSFQLKYANNLNSHQYDSI